MPFSSVLPRELITPAMVSFTVEQTSAIRREIKLRPIAISRYGNEAIRTLLTESVGLNHRLRGEKSMECFWRRHKRKKPGSRFSYSTFRGRVPRARHEPPRVAWY